MQLPDQVINDDFRLLTDLLDEVEDVAAGRAAIPLSDEDRARLDKLAEGDCDKSERGNLINQLVSNSEAMNYFAEALKVQETKRKQNRA